MNHPAVKKAKNKILEIVFKPYSISFIIDFTTTGSNVCTVYNSAGLCGICVFIRADCSDLNCRIYHK